ncbi:MAG: pyridoxine 5'-phosphate synthase [Elusimicrobia bacterium]|jgi:pyridoxine 5-phosphate synthase|nr:pyridoxine 5'-phosphate synthase [Elusimicrobiota bacterium]
MTLLGVNIDHVATVRQARRSTVPDVVAAAQVALASGADSITVHLREDRRHIQDMDVSRLSKIQGLRLNLEMAATEEMVRIASVLRPFSVCLVPERRQELTTEGGLDVMNQMARVRGVCQKISSKGIKVSLFIGPDLDQVTAAKDAGAHMVEIHTGTYADAPAEARGTALKKVEEAGLLAHRLGLVLNAGHGLDYQNVLPIATLDHMNELNIGFSIIARSLFVGLESAVREMKTLVAGVERRT